MNRPEPTANSLSHYCRNALLLLVAAALGWGVAPRARAFTPADADAVFLGYNRAFYFTNRAGGFFHQTTEGGKTWFWDRAEELEMLLDTYERTTDPACLTMFSNVYNGFVADHGTKWGRNDFNDDIMWMVIACARANQLTGNTNFFKVAKSNFEMCFARAWSTNLGGGLWWKTTNRSKNACVNGPGAIAAFLLYRISGDPAYLQRSRAMFEWERNTLFDPQSGRICDNIDISGRISRKSFSYNQGTFIGAANFLGYTNEAVLAADFTRDHLCREGILPDYGQEGDAAGFNGICVRWLVKFMKDRGLQARYESWLQTNANQAWKNRRAGDNLSWSRWSWPTPAGTLYSWGCSSAVVILQVVPADGMDRHG
jgi:predicted alpha-1,6-mannanase (GH76 family)